MLFFGLGFSWLQQYLHRYYRTIYTYGRHTVAVVAIGVGVLLLVKTV
jgi:hypothetical protein